MSGTSSWLLSLLPYQTQATARQTGIVYVKHQKDGPIQHGEKKAMYNGLVRIDEETQSGGRSAKAESPRPTFRSRFCWGFCWVANGFWGFPQRDLLGFVGTHGSWVRFISNNENSLFSCFSQLFSAFLSYF